MIGTTCGVCLKELNPEPVFPESAYALDDRTYCYVHFKMAVDKLPTSPYYDVDKYDVGPGRITSRIAV